MTETPPLTWQEQIIEELRGRLKQEEDALTQKRKIDLGAPAFWNRLTSELKSFCQQANERLGRNLFSFFAASLPNLTCGAKYRSGAESGRFSWDKTKQEIELTVLDKSELFKLGLNKRGEVVAVDVTGTLLEAQTLVEDFARALTGVSDGSEFRPPRRTSLL